MRVERIAHTQPACRTKIWLQALHRMNSAFTLDPIISASARGQLYRPGWRSNVMAHMVGSPVSFLTYGRMVRAVNTLWPAAHACFLQSLMGVESILDGIALLSVG